MAAHADQIGLIVTHVDEHGYVFVERIGGVAPSLVPGRHFVIHGRDGDVHAVGGRKPTHIIPAEDRDKAPRLHEQFLDIGAGDREAALGEVTVGDPVTFTPDFFELGRRGRHTGARRPRRPLRHGPRARAVRGRPGAACLAGLATVHEETTFMGAKALALRLRPDVLIVLDGDFCSDTPAADAKELAGEVKLGAGPVLSRGAGSNERLVRARPRGRRVGGPRRADQGVSGRDRDRRRRTDGRRAAATLTIGLPMRYMHSPFEVARRATSRPTARLVAALARRIGEEPSTALEAAL